MKFLIQDFLDYSQLKSDKFRKNIKPFNIKDTVDRVLSIQKKKAIDSGVMLVAKYPGFRQAPGEEGRSLVVNADEGRIVQILLNLQSNALKFTEAGSVTLTVSTFVADCQEYLQVEVADTGIGIKKEDQASLFKLFGFLEDSAQLNTNGIGLGLVISKQLVEQFGGKIWLESEVDVGTTFTFNVKLPKQSSMSVRQTEEDQEVEINQDELVFRWQPKDNENKVKYINSLERAREPEQEEGKILDDTVKDGEFDSFEDTVREDDSAHRLDGNSSPKSPVYETPKHALLPDRLPTFI
jgi:hypothetical protein